MSINKLLDISKNSLLVYQKALAVTSNNISNANNPYYSRQIVVFGTETPDYLTGLSIGSGVKIDDIFRAKNQILENQIIGYNQKYSFADKQSSILQGLETLLSEPTDAGISNLIQNFFNSFEELANNPTSTPLRLNVIQSAQMLSSKFQNVYEGFLQNKNQLKQEATDTVTLINNYTEQINLLNKQIYESRIKGNEANDLLDKRDEVIDKLSKIVNINVSIDKDNVANVSIGGFFAADKIQFTKFKLSEVDGKLILTNDTQNAQPNVDESAQKVQVTSGELGAIVKTYNSTIPDYLKQLDTIGESIVKSVNEIHSKGYTITEPQVTGINFFEKYDTGSLVINSDILKDSNLIAASSDSTIGNNEIAKQIASLKEQKILNGLSIGESYSSFINSIANTIQQSQQNYDTYDLVLNQLNQQKASYSGVSVDEEMMNIIKYQRSFDASAKLVSVADKLLETIINMV